MLHTAEQVAAPQQLAANEKIYIISVCLSPGCPEDGETYSSHAGHSQQWKRK